MVAVFMYSVQIYCDFSGYTDIARGAAGLLGIDLKENFKAPYLASSVKEIKRIEKGREGVYYFPISELPDLSDYTNYSALSEFLLWKASDVIEVKEV